jgi:hypothetical protein
MAARRDCEARTERTRRTTFRISPTAFRTFPIFLSLSLCPSERATKPGHPADRRTWPPSGSPTGERPKAWKMPRAGSWQNLTRERNDELAKSRQKFRTRRRRKVAAAGISIDQSSAAGERLLTSAMEATRPHVRATAPADRAKAPRMIGEWITRPCPAAPSRHPGRNRSKMLGYAPNGRFPVSGNPG